MTRESTPDTPENNVLCSSFSPITTQPDFKALDSLKEKKTLPKASKCIAKVTLCYHAISTSWLRNVGPKPCRDPKQSLYIQNIPCSQDRLTHVQLLFTWNPSPLQSSKFSFEYLLLPPRSALDAVSPRLTPQAAQQHPRPPTHGSLALASMAEYRSRASAPSIFGAN